MSHYVQFIDRSSWKVVQQIECDSERDAERVKSGASINLSHDEYKLEISTEKSPDCEATK